MRGEQERRGRREKKRQKAITGRRGEAVKKEERGRE